jgi:hypothetical protein
MKKGVKEKISETLSCININIFIYMMKKIATRTNKKRRTKRSLGKKYRGGELINAVQYRAGIECSICLDRLTREPCVFICGLHHFCKECTMMHVVLRGEDAKCPVCNVGLDRDQYNNLVNDQNNPGFFFRYFQRGPNNQNPGVFIGNFRDMTQEQTDNLSRFIAGIMMLITVVLFFRIPPSTHSQQVEPEHQRVISVDVIPLIEELIRNHGNGNPQRGGFTNPGSILTEEKTSPVSNLKPGDDYQIFIELTAPLTGALQELAAKLSGKTILDMLKEEKYPEVNAMISAAAGPASAAGGVAGAATDGPTAGGGPSMDTTLGGKSRRRKRNSKKNKNKRKSRKNKRSKKH